MKPKNYLTIDVEDYFQVSAFESIVSRASWESFPSRVEQNTHLILSLLEKNGVEATFFILGWIAQQHPELVKAISSKGHDIGCHSFNHKLVYNQTPEEFRDDTRQAKDIIEQITGKPVYGYRAPSFSITQKSLWALPILHDLGFSYDSSVFPIYHDRYGIPESPRYPFTWDLSGDSPRIIRGRAHSDNAETGATLREYPISTSMILGKKIPVSGGGYFRLFPYWLTEMALKKINADENKQFVFYLHPWELDPAQPRFNTASALSKFRHYNNLDKTRNRFVRLLATFSFGPMHHQPDSRI
jgi:polysaccharide deacetylase family protein (PEP-CTERM system associated)